VAPGEAASLLGVLPSVPVIGAPSDAHDLGVHTFGIQVCTCNATTHDSAVGARSDPAMKVQCLPMKDNGHGNKCHP
jgi:hypothetical protein